MTKIIKKLFLMICFFGCFACESNDGYKEVTVIKMFAVFTPDNLADDPECYSLWNNIDSFGVDMDQSRKDWNQIILTSAYQLIEKGRVKQKIKSD